VYRTNAIVSQSDPPVGNVARLVGEFNGLVSNPLSGMDSFAHSFTGQISDFLPGGFRGNLNSSIAG